tara:strand:+ start:57 stop:539 length:483 start_codon:yes stop_codon:yes gene_type:complete
MNNDIKEYLEEHGENKRPSWHETWMNIAKVISHRSYDKRLKVGAIIISADNTTVLSVGYNGNYMGGPHIPTSDVQGESEFLHCEINALLKCDYHFHKKKIMYITHFPCRMCCKALINGGVKRVIYEAQYRDMSGITFLRDANIEVYSLKEILLKEYFIQK